MCRDIQQYNFHLVLPLDIRFYTKLSGTTNNGLNLPRTLAFFTFAIFSYIYTSIALRITTTFELGFPSRIRSCVYFVYSAFPSPARPLPSLFQALSCLYGPQHRGVSSFCLWGCGVCGRRLGPSPAAADFSAVVYGDYCLLLQWLPCSHIVAIQQSISCLPAQQSHSLRFCICSHMSQSDRFPGFLLISGN